MSGNHRWRRVRGDYIGALVFAAGIFLISGCNKSNSPAVDTGAARSQSNSPVQSQGFSDPLDSLTDASKAYLSSLDFSKQDGSLEDFFNCKDAGACPPLGKVKLRIVPESKAGEKDWLKALTGKNEKGFVVARITNLETTLTFDALGLAPGESAIQSVGPLTAGEPERGVAFFKLDADNKPIGPAMEIVRTVQYCDDDNPEGGLNPKDPPKVFINKPHTTAHCWTLERRAGKQVAPATNKFPSAGLWISCSGGCCQISTT